MIVVATFYKFVQLADFAQKRVPLWTYCESQAVKGTILLAMLSWRFCVPIPV
jgi:UPF0176 protein